MDGHTASWIVTYEWTDENAMQCNAPSPSPPKKKEHSWQWDTRHTQPHDSRFIIFPAASILLPRASSGCNLTRRCSNEELRRPASPRSRGKREASLRHCARVCDSAALSAGSPRHPAEPTDHFDAISRHRNEGGGSTVTVRTCVCTAFPPDFQMDKYIGTYLVDMYLS